MERMRRWLFVIGTIAAAILITTVYVLQPTPKSALGEAVGVRQGLPFRSPFCGWLVRETRLGTWRTGKVVCAWYRPETPHRRAALDELSYHVLTRRVYSADRSWEPLSYAAWQRDVDSVRLALRIQGGVPTPGLWSRPTPNGWQSAGASRISL